MTVTLKSQIKSYSHCWDMTIDTRVSSDVQPAVIRSGTRGTIK